MAIVTWIGAAQARRQVTTLTVGSNTNGHTFTTTINGKSITYTAASDSTSTIASHIKSLLEDSNEGEFSELEYEVSANVVTVTGPENGLPFSMTTGGTGTYTASTIVTPISPHDAGLGTNYSTGSIPNGNDTLVLENSSVSILSNLTALANIPLTYERRETYRGQIGLPDTSVNGYREYRDTHLNANGPEWRWYESNDNPGQSRIAIVSTPAVAWKHVGTGGVAVGQESVEVTGLPANSTVNISGGSLTVAPLASQTANVTSLRSINSTLRFGSNMTLVTADLKDTTFELRCGYTTLTMDGATTVVVLGVGDGDTTSIQGGTMRWLSTGTFGNLTIGAGGAMDLKDAPLPVAAGTITLEAGSILDNTRDRIEKPWSYERSNCTAQEVRVLTAAGGNVTEAS